MVFTPCAALHHTRCTTLVQMQYPTSVLYTNNTIHPNNYMFTPSKMLKTPIQALYNQENYQERVTICKNDYAVAGHSEKLIRGIVISS